MHGQRYGQRQPLGDQVRHRRAVGIAVAEIADQEAADPVQVANDQRLVEPELDGHRADRFGRGVRAHQHLGGVARQRIEHEEDDQRGARKRRKQGQKAAENEDAHGFVPAEGYRIDGSSGHRSSEFCAASNSAETRSNSASPRNRPTSCRPIGSPSAPKPQDTLTAGCPVIEWRRGSKDRRSSSNHLMTR